MSDTIAARPSLRSPASTGAPRLAIPALGRLDWAIVALSSIAAIAAFVGGVGLIVDPDGSMLGFPPGLLAGTGFDSYRVPGVGLLLLGALQVAAVLVALRRNHEAWPIPFVAGTALAAWTAVQVALIGPVSWLQGAVFVLGWMIALAAFALSLERTSAGAWSDDGNTDDYLG